MKIICLIDSLNSGGAQRQLTLLASGLAKEGYQVKVAVFHPLLFFFKPLEKAGVKIEILQSTSKLNRFLKLKYLLKKEKPEVVISFLNAPNFLAELVKISSFQKKFRLIVSERRGFEGKLSLKEKVRLAMHYSAGGIITNSERAKTYIGKYFPSIKGKIHTIYNIVNFEEFNYHPIKNNNIPQIVVVANYRKEKNITSLILAAEQLKKENFKFQIHWYGNRFFLNDQPSGQSSSYLAATTLIEKKALTDYFVLHGVNNNLSEIYHQADALCLTSRFEGLPNVVCEAMACGRPILSSDVSDIKHIITHMETGFIFNPINVNSIQEALKWLIGLTNEEKKEIGRKNFETAKSLFDQKVILKQVKKLIH